MNKYYVYEENYLNKEDCQKLINYFDQNIKVKNETNVNRSFDNRVIYYEGVNNQEIKQLMKRIHDDMAKKIKDFYKEDSPILPEATHIVKWPTGTELGDHADNAYADGTPNYVPWRTYSCVVYLNEDFTGGEFYFKRFPYKLTPSTGLVIGFRGGIEFIHGVKKVTSGNRYALPMWFCQDKEKAYPEYR